MIGSPYHAAGNATHAAQARTQHCDPVIGDFSDVLVDSPQESISAAISTADFERQPVEDQQRQSLLHHASNETRFTPESFLIDSWGESSVGITRVGDPAADPVLLLAGLGGHSGLFLGPDQQGFAGYLAEQGFCCYLIDVADKGVSGQLTAANDYQPGTTDNGLFGWVTQDLPAVVAWVAERHTGQRQRWVGHGAAGLVWWALWARYPEFRAHCTAIMQVATVRSSDLVQAGSKAAVGRRTRFKCWLSKRRLVQALVGPRDQVPLQALGLGLCNETRATFSQWLAWCRGPEWVDPVDGFSYSEVIRHAKRQPFCSCWVAENGVCASEPGVRALMGSLRLQNPRLFVIKAPFDNVSLLTSPKAVQNHFPAMLNWLSLGRNSRHPSVNVALGSVHQA